MTSDTSRLDNFTDAAFAFAVTLLVIGGGSTPDSYGDLERALVNVPAFAMGFALIGMFWHAHVRWRRMCGSGGFVAVALTLLLVFLVLVYVYPLRLIAMATVAWIGGDWDRMFGLMGERGLARLFTLYAAGFIAMSGTVAALFAHGRRAVPPKDADTAEAIRVELGTWLILIGVGAVSMGIAQVPGIAMWAGMAYSALPVLIGVWVHLATRGRTPT